MRRNQPDNGEVLERGDLLGLVDVAVVGLQLLADGLELGVGGDELVDRRLGATVDQKVELFHWKKRSGSKFTRPDFSSFIPD